MRLLISTGGSPHSMMAVGYGAHIARATGGEVTLLCVEEGGTDCAAVFEEARPLMNGLSFHTRVREGHPAEQVLRETEELDYDMVVMGEKGRHTPVTRFLIGPTAERVATRARLPVMVVKADPQRGQLPPIRRILFSMALRERFSEVDRIVRRIRAIAGGTGASVTVLHVMSQMPIPPAGTPDDWEATAAELMEMETAEGTFLEYVLGTLREAGIRAEAIVRHGLVIEEVLAESRSGDYDLLAIGGHEPGTWLENLVLENVSLQILHQSRLPVLAVHG